MELCQIALNIGRLCLSAWDVDPGENECAIENLHNSPFANDEKCKKAVTRVWLLGFLPFFKAIPGCPGAGGAATLEGNGARPAVQFASGILPCFCLSGSILQDRQPTSWESTLLF